MGGSRRKRRTDTTGIHTRRRVTDLVRLIQEKDESVIARNGLLGQKQRLPHKSLSEK
jgi:hypothetical protein